MIDLRDRTKRFAVRLFDFVDEIPGSRKGLVVQTQLAKAASSVAANYRAAQRSRSRAEFISKLSIVFEELDECAFWLDFLPDTRLASLDMVRPLLNEADELLAIFATARKTARSNAGRR